MEIVLDTFACAESLGEVSIEMNGDSVELWPQPFQKTPEMISYYEREHSSTLERM